ncbi:sugar ABC transporter ATP-binding protein [Fodinicurvata sp. EGI_FJ10296]|uniref:sugar ABC transporter ATP-binding protein n=1 Tax=Fodinicurvata sp. EGI_FJ10296 TaxID=3231908 RepID=UPI003452CCD9
MSAAKSADSSASFINIVDVSKRFGGVQALTDVGFSIDPGEIVCLAGENGSGKSTLIKVLSGVVEPTTGRIEIDGQSFDTLTPRLSVQHGIQVIYQDFALFGNLSVAENIAFSAELSAGRTLVRWRAMRELAARVLDRVGVKVDLDARVDTLALADKQLVAICRALSSEARLIIMDEPTTALTGKEVDSLLAIIRRLKQDGIAVLFVSHKLAEVMEVCEKIVVLRNGRSVAEGPAADFTLTSLGHHMTGRHFSQSAPVPLPADAPTLLKARGLVRGESLRNVDLDLHAGEVLGITGLLGSGRTALAKALFGLVRLDGGTIEIDGKPVEIGSPEQAIDAGIGYVPEDRLTEGLFLNQSISRNIAIGRLDAHTSPTGFLDRKSMAADVRHWLDRLQVVASGAEAPVESLSGGNQQRVVLARWLSTHPRILILNGPTVGVDIGSKADIHEIIRGLADSGLGVIVISDDIPEILGACHRILIMKDGRLTEEIAGGSVDEDELVRRLAS